MSCDFPCPSEERNYNYVFNIGHKTLEEANNSCKEQGGTLASGLMRPEYSILYTCCTKVQKFRIGLIAENSTCNKNNFPFHWIGNSEVCLDKGFLNVETPTRTACQSVSLDFTFRSRDEEFFNASLNDCNKSLPFICQLPKRQQSRPMPNATELVASTAIAGTTPKPGSAHIISAIAGASVGFFLILLLLLILFIRRYRRFRTSKKTFGRRSSDFSEFQKNNLEQEAIKSV